MYTSNITDMLLKALKNCFLQPYFWWWEIGDKLELVRQSVLER